MSVSEKERPNSDHFWGERAWRTYRYPILVPKNWVPSTYWISSLLDSLSDMSFVQEKFVHRQHVYNHVVLREWSLVVIASICPTRREHFTCRDLAKRATDTAKAAKKVTERKPTGKYVLSQAAAEVTSPQSCRGTFTATAKLDAKSQEALNKTQFTSRELTESEIPIRWENRKSTVPLQLSGIGWRFCTQPPTPISAIFIIVLLITITKSPYKIEASPQVTCTIRTGVNNAASGIDRWWPRQKC